MTEINITQYKLDALVGVRFLSWLLYVLLLLVPTTLLSALALRIFYDQDSAQMVVGVYVLFYFIVTIVLILNRSHGIGQHLLNIQVVDHQTEAGISFWRYFLLWHVVGKSLIIGLIPIVNIVFLPIYSLIDNLFIFRKDRRAIHDLIAGTRVIKLPLEQQRKKLIDFTRI